MFIKHSSISKSVLLALRTCKSQQMGCGAGSTSGELLFSPPGWWFNPQLTLNPSCSFRSKLQPSVSAERDIWWGRKCCSRIWSCSRRLPLFKPYVVTVMFTCFWVTQIYVTFIQMWLIVTHICKRSCHSWKLG